MVERMTADDIRTEIIQLLEESGIADMKQSSYQRGLTYPVLDMLAWWDIQGRESGTTTAFLMLTYELLRLSIEEEGMLVFEFSNEVAPFEWMVWEQVPGGTPDDAPPSVFRGEVKYREDKQAFCYTTADVTLTEAEMFEIWAFLRAQHNERQLRLHVHPADLHIVDEEKL